MDCDELFYIKLFSTYNDDDDGIYRLFRNYLNNNSFFYIEFELTH